MMTKALRWFHEGESPAFGNCPDVALAVQSAAGLPDERITR